MDFEIPGDIAGLNDEALTEAVESAYTAADDLSQVDDADMTDEQIDRLRALGSFLRDAKTEQASRSQAAEARAAEIAEIRAAVTREEEPEVTEDEPEAVVENPADEIVDEEPEAEAVAVEPEVVVEETPAEPVLVTASATTATPSRKKNIVARAAQAAPEQEVAPSRPRPSIVASAEAKELTGGQKLEALEDLVPSLIRRFDSFPKNGKRYARNDPNRPPMQRFGVASIEIENPLNDIAYPDPQALLAAAADETRLSSGSGSGSLTAAGGWCAPSETVYDLCGPLATNDGVVDLPEINVSRGGLRFSKGIDWAALFAGDLAGVGGTQTEAQAEAGVEKDCLELECPDFEDHRLDAEYLCVKIPLLTEAGWPELVRDFISGHVLAHQVKLARKDLADMLTIAGAAVSVDDVWPNALSILHALELAILGERQRHNMSENATLEVVLPTWVRGAIRADLANRTGVESYNVSDAQIGTFFTTRGARVQFVKRWPNLDLDISGGVATAYPENIEALIYPAGTFVRGRADVIRLDAIYDAPSLQVNTYTGLFAEQGRFVINRCYTPRRISLALTPTGRTAAADISQTWAAEASGGPGDGEGEGE